MISPPRSAIRSFHVPAPRKVVFPLFTADGERDWAKSWNPTVLSGDVERGSAFRTYDGENRETVWIVTTYDPRSGRASYARVAYGSHIGLIDVECADSPAGGTTVSVRYTLTPLSDASDDWVSSFLDDAQYEEMIRYWEAEVSAAVARRTERG